MAEASGVVGTVPGTTVETDGRRPLGTEADTSVQTMAGTALWVVMEEVVVVMVVVVGVMVGVVVEVEVEEEEEEV